MSAVHLTIDKRTLCAITENLQARRCLELCGVALILWHTEPKYLIISYGILIDSAAIAGIALYGVDDAVLHLLHDANVVGKAVLRPGTALVVIAIGNPPLLLPS